ncbi:hypothetical protein AMATHDRAFT_71730 [Amanita thiersii Skay4041]|uniref:Uncharacterized protein n=1 Tax=Amanita thiersii Skay4041 TaxID=703135 RepID=A0A2A9NAY9_9AGAR|nr:hypothetical protein AMATHDRAFT_71730 [Amanita thiersii Skay4041]
MNGTFTSSRSGLSGISVYHTPSSSLFDQDMFESALSSPVGSPVSTSPGLGAQVNNSTDTHNENGNGDTLKDTTYLDTHDHEEAGAGTSLTDDRRAGKKRRNSAGTASSGATVTPSLFAREGRRGGGAPSASSNRDEDDISINIGTMHNDDDDDDAQLHSVDTAPEETVTALERGPRLFFTSAKTGEGVADVFEYIAARVVRRVEYEEALEERRIHVREGTGDTAIVRLSGGGWGKVGEDWRWGRCC